MAFAMRQETMTCTPSRANPVAAAKARHGTAARPARGARAPLGKAKVGRKLAGARLVRAEAGEQPPAWMQPGGGQEAPTTT